MPRTKEQREQIREEKRKIIKETALKLFAEKGFDATSIHEITRNAGISKGLMYNYFSSKEDLLRMIWDDLTTEFGLMIDPDNNGEVTDYEAQNFIDDTFEMLKNRRGELKLYFQMSFQPKVVNFLMTKYNVENAQKRQNQIFGYFAKKMPSLSNEFGFFSVLVFFKGLSMVTTYTENTFSNDFLDGYKLFLKQLIFQNNQS
jgi:AcrR family transcriptional regulator